MNRLATNFWVQAYLLRLSQQNIPGFVVKRGDSVAGAVLIKLNTLDGKAAVYQRNYDLVTGQRRWLLLSEGEESVVDESLARQQGFDPDLWVIEVEDRQGRHLLGEVGLE